MTPKKLLGWLPLCISLVVLMLFAQPVLKQKDPAALSSALIGQPVPDFVLPAALEGGDLLRSAVLRRGPVLVNFFSSWCVPCAAEQKQLAEIAARENIKIYGIAYKDRRADLSKFLSSHGNPFQAIGFDIDGKVSIDWGVYGVPETFVIDKRGIIRYRHVGPLTARDDKKWISPLLKALKR